MSQRHRARRLALQALCCLDVQGERAREMIDEFIQDSRESAKTRTAARKLFTETFAVCGEIDALLTRHARHWELSRLALVDRNILRLATYELRGPKTPFKVVISEALRLAQEFSAAESPRFINGVLDAIAREIAGQEGDQETTMDERS